MSSSIKVVTDVAEIARLNKQLAKRLRDTLPFKSSREITYPSGYHTGDVFFELESGSAVRAWSPRNEPNKLLNFILAGDPESSDRMEISVQLNFPAKEYNRRRAGAFVKDENGDIFVAHRGKLTKGNAGLSKASVLREFAASTVEAEDAGKVSTLILISALDDAALVDRLWEFGVQAREVATRLGEEAKLTRSGDDSTSIGSKKTGSVGSREPKNRLADVLKLRAYFDEHAGEGQTKGHGGGKRVVEHGDIVKALEAQMRARGTSQKAQAIDLAIVAAKTVDLFEVKTSARTTDVYTGVGQLLIHGECISELLRLPVRRHLVVPDRPKESHEKHISNKADINVVTFHRDGAAYRFEGLPP